MVHVSARSRPPSCSTPLSKVQVSQKAPQIRHGTLGLSCSSKFDAPPPPFFARVLSLNFPNTAKISLSEASALSSRCALPRWASRRPLWSHITTIPVAVIQGNVEGVS